MTLRAVQPELAVVNILVAAETVVVFDPVELLKFLPVFDPGFMAGNTGHCLVFSDQLELCPCVAEF